MSYHSKPTKLAALNSFRFRAINFLLSRSNFDSERNKIYEITHVNGYSSRIVDSRGEEYKNKKDFCDLTILTPNNVNNSDANVNLSYTGVIFVDDLTTEITSIFGKFQ